MATCRGCQQKGLFLRLNSNGYCSKCEQEISDAIRDGANACRTVIDAFKRTDDEELLRRKCETAIRSLDAANAKLQALKWDTSDIPGLRKSIEDLQAQIKPKAPPNNKSVGIGTDAPLISDKIVDADLEVLRRLNKTEVSIQHDGDIVAQYAGGNVKACAEKLLKHELLSIQKGYNALDYYSVSDLKTVLKKAGQKVSGKKQELIERIRETCEPGILDQTIGDVQLYAVTVEGRKVLDEYAIRIEVEFNALLDEMTGLNSLQRFQDAHKLMAAYEARKPLARGLGVNWNSEVQQGVSTPALKSYESFFNAHAEPALVKGCLISCHMLDMPYTKARNKLERRLNGTGYDLSCCTDEYIGACMTEMHSYEDIEDYKEGGISKYEILTTRDESTCPACKKHVGKKYKVSEAKVGVNLPPFCDHCRCTTVAYFSKKQEAEWERTDKERMDR